MNRLLRLREKRHLSQQELGKILGVSQQQLSKYESGQSLMHSDFIIQCAEFFSVTTDYLLGVNLYEESGNISYVASPNMAENINLEHKLTHLFRCLPQSLKEYIVHSEEYLLDNFVKEVKDVYI